MSDFRRKFFWGYLLIIAALTGLLTMVIWPGLVNGMAWSIPILPWGAIIAAADVLAVAWWYEKGRAEWIRDYAWMSSLMIGFFVLAMGPSGIYIAAVLLLGRLGAVWGLARLAKV